MLRLLLIVLSIQVALADDCELKRARVNLTSKTKEGIQYFWVGNLDKQIVIPISKAEENSKLAQELRASNLDSGVFLNVSLKKMTCERFVYQTRGVYTLPGEILTVNRNQNKQVDCIDCVKMSNAPIALVMPSIPEMKKILDRAAGFSPEKVNLTTSMIVHLFERMNAKTPNANGAVFMVSLFRAFDQLGLKKIDHDQLMYLVDGFKEKLGKSEQKLLSNIFANIDSLNFSKGINNNLVVSINTVKAKTITVKGKDIPVQDVSAREMMDKYFGKIDIENGTSMEFADSDIKTTKTKASRNSGLSSFEISTISKPSTVNLKGITVLGQFPVIGEINVKPQRLEVDIDSETPVKANVGFKMGFVGMSYTFNLDN